MLCWALGERVGVVVEVCLGVCASFVVWVCVGEFARLCICRKGERHGALNGGRALQESNLHQIKIL